MTATSIQKTSRSSLEVYYDGACINYVKGGWGFRILEHGKVIVEKCGRIKGTKAVTNNVAEHYALGQALSYLIEAGWNNDKITIYGDNKMSVKQLEGDWIIKSLQAPYAKFAFKNIELARKFSSISFKWIPRHFNKEADLLSKRGMAMN